MYTRQHAGAKLPYSTYLLYRHLYLLYRYIPDIQHTQKPMGGTATPPDTTTTHHTHTHTHTNPPKVYTFPRTNRTAYPARKWPAWNLEEDKVPWLDRHATGEKSM